MSNKYHRIWITQNRTILGSKHYIKTPTVIIESSSHGSVSIKTRLRTGRSGFNSRQGQWWNFFSLRHLVHTDFGAQPPSNSMGTAAISSGGKRPGREADIHLHLMTRLRIRGAIPPLQHVLMVLYLVKYTDFFTFVFTLSLPTHTDMIKSKMTTMRGMVKARQR